MRGNADDPFSSLPFLPRRALRHRLRRAWRQGMAKRRAQTLDALSEVVGSDPVVTAGAHRRGPGAVTEIIFSSGLEVRLSSCHGPTISTLARLAADGVVTLHHAAYHGDRWGLYFTTGYERLPLLATEISLRAQPGGPGRGDDLRGPLLPQATLLPA